MSRILAFLLALATAAEAKTPEPPKSLVPKGWKCVEAASGDLNRDGKDDWVLKLGAEAKGKAKGERLLVALTKGAAFDVVSHLAKAPDSVAVDDGVLQLIYQKKGNPFELQTEFFSWKWEQDRFRLASYSGKVTTYGKNAGTESGGSDVRVDFSTRQVESSQWALNMKKASLRCDLPESYAVPEFASFDAETALRPPGCAKP